jgi:hypothetical protein
MRVAPGGLAHSFGLEAGTLMDDALFDTAIWRDMDPRHFGLRLCGLRAFLRFFIFLQANNGTMHMPISAYIPVRSCHARAAFRGQHMY